MIGRNRRYGSSRKAPLKARIGIAAAVAVGGGAIAVAAVATTGHGAESAKSAGFFTSAGHSSMGESNALSGALASWNTSQQRSMEMLSDLTSEHTFSQAWHKKTELAVQRGIVVLATRDFLLVRSQNGSMHLWMLGHGTKVKNVSDSMSGTMALTGSQSATTQAMSGNNMVPATSLLAGSTTTADQMTTPMAKPQTVSVQVAGTGVTVTVTITSTSATVTQASPSSVTTMHQSAFSMQQHVRRGDLVLVAGVREHGYLHAQLVLFTQPATTTMTAPTSTPTATATPGATPTGTATPSTTPTGTATPEPGATETSGHW